MSKRTRKAFLGTGAVIAFTAIALVPIIGKPQPPANWTDMGDAWATFVYNYQTLITGLSAIGAAVYTVRQMKDGDRRTDKRHRQTVKMTIRRDMLFVERLVVGHADRFIALRDLADSFTRGAADQKGDELLDYVYSNLHMFGEVETTVEYVLNTTEWKGAKELFDGAMSTDVEQLRIVVHVASATAQMMADGYATFKETKYVPLEEVRNAEIDKVMIPLINRNKAMAGLLSNVSLGLGRLAKFYEIEV